MPHHRAPFLVLPLLFSALASPAFAQDSDDRALEAETLEFVEKKVRPLLESRCFECHSRGSKEIKGELLLDSHAAILEGGESGPAVVPGKPNDSLLIEAINYESFEMPPRSKLPDGEIAILTKWVELGAPLPGKSTAGLAKPLPFPLKQRMAQHWAWTPIKQPTAPASRSDWPRSDIDRFILARLEAGGLEPAARASRRTLIRRLYFDLIGLPPTPAQVQAFVANPNDDHDAISELVDQLLASKHFGERWGRHWLDLMRFAETLGHEFDYPLHHAHEYRDYVIRAFNADVPYDQLATEHIAGDLVEHPRRHPTEGFNESLIGTGFWYLGEAKHAPVDVRREEATTIDNQIDVFSRTFLGLTVACARCHDHKFDAISARDYYALAGLMQSSIRQIGMLDPGRRIETVRQQMEAIQTKADKALAESLTESLQNVDEESVQRWAGQLKDKSALDVESPLFLLASTATVSSEAFASQFDIAREKVVAAEMAARQSRQQVVHFASFEDGLPEGWSYVGEAFASTPVTDGTEWDWRAAASVRRVSPGYASSNRSSTRFQGVLRSPVFEITHDQVLYSGIGQDARVRLIIEGFRMDEFNALLFKGAKLDVKTNGKHEWFRQGGDIRNHKKRRAHIEVGDFGNGHIAVKEIAFSNGATPGSAPAAASHEILEQKPATLSDLVKATVTLARRGIGGETLAATELSNAMLQHGLISASGAAETLSRAKQQLVELEKQITAPRPVIAASDGPAENERLFIRGSHTNLGAVVPRRLLEAFGSAPINKPFGSGRLEVARQLFSESNPLTARVMANRVWHHLFGRGIVASTDNFGVLGKRPTHPELLDYLATQLRADGWSLKRFIKRLVMTQTYQMASRNPQVDSSEDPANLLLHRAPIKRLQGEAIRDALLSVSGRLDTKQFGPSVPVHLTKFMQGRGRPRQSGPLDGDGRRSIYIKINRNFLSPFMLAFDTPIPFTSIGTRSKSNVPAQALILLNDPLVTQQAEVWAKRLIKEATNGTARVTLMYELAFAREPTEIEVNRALGFLKSQAGDGWLNNVEAWKDLCHVLINTKEFIFLN